MPSPIPHISKAQIKWVRSLQQKKVRDAEGVFVAEGDKCIGELLPAFDLILHVVTDTKSPTRSHLYEVTCIASDTEIEQMSSMRTPQGSIAVFRKPSYSPQGGPTAKWSNSEAVQQGLCPDLTGEIILALDGIQDPGNLGTIIRTCDWFGVHDIYCSRETADCYNPKVVQATMGALARVRIHYVDLAEWLQSIQRLAPSGANDSTIQQEAHGLPIYGTLLNGRNMYENDAIPNHQNGIIIMGNEGNGISPEVRRLITHPLYIPSFSDMEQELRMKQDMPSAPRPSKGEVGRGSVESLNVSIATAIILAEFRRGIR